MIGRNPDIKEIINALGNTYTGIDSRAILAKKDSDWVCVFAKVRPTRQGKSDIETIHGEKIQKLGTINNDKVKVVMQYDDITELDRILQEIGNKVLTIRGIHSQLQFTANNISGGKAWETEDYVNNAEAEGFAHLSLTNPMDHQPSSFLNTLGITRSEMGMGFDDVASFFDVDKMVIPNNVVMLFPIYCKQLEVPVLQRKDLVARFMVHDSLANSIVATVRRIQGTTTSVRNSYRLIDRVVKKEGNMCQVELPMPVTNVYMNDYVGYELEHPTFGIIFANTIPADELKEILLVDDSLLSVFKAFEANNNFLSDLFSNKEANHVAATSWLFSMMGFRTLTLGVVNRSYESLTGPQGKRYSADLLAHQERFLHRVFVIDCTTGVPDAQKLDHIKNTAEQIIAMVGQEVIPVIVSTQDCSIVKSDASSRGVLLLDKDLVQTCVNHVISGKRLNALNLVRQIYTASGGKV